MRALLTTLIAALAFLHGSDSYAQTLDVAEIKPERQSGFAQAGWKYDRYSDMPSLDAQTRMKLADLKGPGAGRSDIGKQVRHGE